MTINEENGVRMEFSAFVKSETELAQVSPLGIFEVNGRFYRYLDGDTDTL